MKINSLDNIINKKKEKLNLLKRVKIIPGYIPSEHFYPKIDIFLNPSLREGLGTTIIESIFLKKKIHETRFI